MCRLQSESAAHEPPEPQQKNPHFNSTKRTHKNYICAFVIITLLLITTTIITILYLHLPRKIEAIPNNSTLNLITREKWSALPSTSTLPQPSSNIVIISHTAGRYCQTPESCLKMVQLIQKYHLSLSADIKYNFLIGGDGNIYEGRGWRAKNCMMEKSVSVAFIGNYVFDVLSESMITALEELLKDGALNGLSVDYKLVGQNQTMNTDSPGGNVYKKIVKLSHYTPELLSNT